MTALNEITRNHSNVSTWLKNNLYSSITNVEISLVLTLLVIAAIQGFISWAFVKASFTTDPVAAKATLDQFTDPGANWGGVIDNLRILMVFRFPQDQTWRIFSILLMLLGLAVPSAFVFRGDTYRRSPVRRILTILWLQGYEGFAAGALDERRAAGWPPYSHLALLRADAPARADVHAFLQAALAAAPARRGPGLRLLGPAPASMEKRAGRHRAQLLVESPGRTSLQEVLAAWLPAVVELRAPRALRWSVDVDPIEVD
jgi:hypothetical protein